jgi:hypothetical protein
MSRRPARCTEADLRRAIRAAKHEGAGDVIALPDGSILIRVSPESAPVGEKSAIEPEAKVVL